MKTIFLASGRSSRMDPISDKNLLEFCGEPLFIKLIKNAQKGGLENFIVVCNKDNKVEIERILQKRKIEAQTAEQKDLNEGMAGGVSAGLALVDDNESVFVLGGNDFVEPEIYKNILDQSVNIDGGILAKKVSEYFPGGYLEVNNDNIIQSIIEKPKKGSEPSDLINIVAHFFQKAEDLKSELKKAKSGNDDVYEVALHNLFQEKKFKAVEYDGAWQAIKYPWHVLDMMNVFMSRQEKYISPGAEIADSAKIKGENVVIEDGARVFDNAVIQGPCYIGKSAVVGNNALVRNSCLGEKSTAGYNTEIARSFLAKNVQTHIAYIGDSVVDCDVNFGAYSCTANLRLDKESVKVNVKKDRLSSDKQKLGAIIGAGVQIGIHAMLMPGCKVEKGGLISPGSVQK